MTTTQTVLFCLISFTTAVFATAFFWLFRFILRASRELSDCENRYLGAP